ncbi:DUF4232 domain-containing protein [Solwaraspora sp. WMMD792]|uniref:DUF4232 domain-containing protein n=1 Tax=Solwaraspora sp. WMMD792 TaxID=3016099 RepID=UPI0024161A59|nr:DUF4232 domain-containing protein [Solwaraspora sp. WMMD792]MDG4772934.1 DUF4232 domain-containing protein [Solwaraspora sp. WMMD792]
MIRRRAGALLLAAVLLAGCAGQLPQPGPQPPDNDPAPVPTPTPVPSADPSPDCPDSGALLSLGAVDAAMGLRAMPIRLANCAEEPVHVDGFPELTVLDEQLQPLAVEVIEGAEAIARVDTVAGGPVPITLQPGQRAGAVLVWRNTVDDVRVPPTHGTFLAVAPAAGVPAQVLEPDGGLDIGTTGRVAVSPWAPAG